MRADSYAGVTPIICANVFSRPATICPDVLISGATATTWGVKTGSFRASASSRVSVDVGSCPEKETERKTTTLPPEKKLWPGMLGRTKSRFVPSSSILDVIVSWAPRPTDMVDITAATPMTMPSSANPVLSLFAPREERAVTAMVSGPIESPPVPRRPSNPRNALQGRR